MQGPIALSVGLAVSRETQEALHHCVCSELHGRADGDGALPIFMDVVLKSTFPSLVHL
jgi:hypothetical protein